MASHRLVLGCVSLLLCLLRLTAASKPFAPPLRIAKQGFFYAGGHDGVDAMFVQYQIPSRITAPYPIVMIHGGGQNGSNFLGTPDDRPGWAEYFLRRGFAVFVVDQPARGRSPYNPALDGPSAMMSLESVENRFTAPEQDSAYPQAKLHTQWPGSGRRGDAVFEQFFASQMASLTDAVKTDVINRQAGVALLRRIGPAILLTHSRSGPFGWEIADDAPELVRGIVAVEPNGPPFRNEGPASSASPRNFGIAYDRLQYAPPVNDAASFAPKREDRPQADGLAPCTLPSIPHKLPRLAGIPVMIVTAEASYHAPYDHCTSQFLTQAGVANDFVLLAKQGIHGNGHMMMLEKNNLEIAASIADWIGRHISKKSER